MIQLDVGTKGFNFEEKKAMLLSFPDDMFIKKIDSKK